MAINVDWDDLTHNSLRFEIDGSWNWDELRWANLQARRLLDTCDHKVSLIYDLQNGDWLPHDGVCCRGRFSTADTHPNYAGVTVLVGIQDFIATFESILRRAYRALRQESHMKEVYYADTLKEARAILTPSHN
jgi:hypothetical protein